MHWVELCRSFQRGCRGSKKANIHPVGEGGGECVKKDIWALVGIMFSKYMNKTHHLLDLSHNYPNGWIQACRGRKMGKPERGKYQYQGRRLKRFLHIFFLQACCKQQVETNNTTFSTQQANKLQYNQQYKQHPPTPKKSQKYGGHDFLEPPLTIR